jgi:multidrug resistance efflux pump
MKKKLSIIITALLAITILAACSPKAAQEDAAATTPQSMTIAEGRLMPVKALDHAFAVGGQVAEVLVADAQSVRKDQVLARLADSAQAEATLAGAEKEALAAQQALEDYQAAAVVNQAQAQIEAILARKRRTTALENANASGSTEARARLDEATGNMDLAQALFERIEANGGLDPDQMNTLEARVAAANANVESARAALDALKLRAAMDGVVSGLGLETGQQVSPGEVVLAVADFSEWIVETDNLTEFEVVKISEAQEVEVTLDALPGTALKGEVVRINERFEEKRGDITYTVTILLKETDPLMRWGMTAAVIFSD